MNRESWGAAWLIAYSPARVLPSEHAPPSWKGMRGEVKGVSSDLKSTNCSIMNHHSTPSDLGAPDAEHNFISKVCHPTGPLVDSNTYSRVVVRLMRGRRIKSIPTVVVPPFSGFDKNSSCKRHYIFPY